MKPQDFYDRDYYDNKCSGKGYGAHGLIYNQECAPFTELALILRSICRPYTATDYGCAKGILVGELRRVGIDTRGYDFSAYAISQANSDIRPFLEQRDLCDEFTYPKCDLAICMDTLEHIDMDKLPGVISRIQKSCEGNMFTMCALSTNPEEYKHEDHVSLMTYGEWADTLTSSGDFVVSKYNERLAVALFDTDRLNQAATNWGLKTILLSRVR